MAMINPEVHANINAKEIINTLAKDAIRALLYEVSVNAKPGLVDPVTSGPHPDMDVFTFIDSAVELEGYFKAVADTALNWSSTLPNLFIKLRKLGQKAEIRMLDATAGVNTHKGVVFSLAILVAAEAYRFKNGGNLRNIIKAMLRDLTKNDFAEAQNKDVSQLTAGEKLYLQFGYTGIRGEAEKGYPVVFEYGLPMLRKTDGTRNQRLLDTLMEIISVNIDTNLLKRSGNDPKVVAWAQNQARQVLKLGGSKTLRGREQLRIMNQNFLERNLSLGGSADLLILTIFIGIRQKLLDFS